MVNFPFFIQFLKLGGRFDPWVKDCPLDYQSNNAPEKIDVLGSLFLSILSGHKRYSHITTLRSDGVNPELLGMNKIVSEDSARKAVKKIDQDEGIHWMQNHMMNCCSPLLKTPWILDVDTTIKPLYGHQENATKGYNPQKPGRPSHTYHTYMMANLRMILEVEVKSGDQSHSSHSLPGLISLLNRLPEEGKPQFVRGDIAWGTETVMTDLENINQRYLFKLKKSKNVMGLIYKHHGIGKWSTVHEGWEAKEDSLQLQGWDKKRRVVIVRRKLSGKSTDMLIGLEAESNGVQQLTLIDGPENTKMYEYSVLVTDLEGYDLTAIFHQYRDRADCENNFDELKNQWGWGGYTTKDIHSCRIMSRMIALIYNWWNLYVRLAFPGKHLEASTSRPLLLSSIGRLVTSGDQRKVKITSMHGKTSKLVAAYDNIIAVFDGIKLIAPQLNVSERWAVILSKILEKMGLNETAADPPRVELSTI